MKERDLLIFLNAINFSSENSLKVLDYLMDKNLPLEDFYKVDFLEEQILSERSANRLDERAGDFDLIIEKISEKIKSIGVHIVTILDKDYPDELRYIEDPPSVL
mgnify:FL=1